MNIEQIVAEQRKSDAIIRSIDDGIIVVESDFKVTGINPTAARVLEIEPEMSSQHRHFLEVIKSELLFGYIKQAIESGKSPKIMESENVISVERGESLHHYQFSITPMHSKTGFMLGVVLVLRDVTKLKELDRLKSEFVMAASHELKTPLTSMVMSIELLQESIIKKLSEKEQQLFSVLHEELQRLKALVNDLLDLSRIEAGKMIMEFDRVSVALLFEKSVAVLKTQADEESIQLSFSTTTGLPDVKADMNKITWILTNLISNALRYTPTGGHIRLFAEQVGPQVHLSVRDDGTGIPYEYQSKIFDKFVQVMSDKASGGSGLGLAICKEIVRAHGGTIWVDSTPGEGSTFTFTLPVAV
jgi:NtrC-family two-component system sensor histidine kinase KinB